VVNAAGAARCRGVRRAAAAVAALTLGGCTLLTDSFLTNEFSGDKFPVHVDASRGALLVGMRPGAPADNVDRVAVLDLLSPFTLIDPRVATAPSLQYADVLLLGKSSTGELTTPRARFPEVQLLSLHPCDTTGANQGASLPACQIGAGSAVSTFDAVLGADALAGDAVRLRLPGRTASDPVPDDQLFVLADIGGSDRGRTYACDAVFGSPYRGGGTLVISGTELPFGNRRITIEACLGQDPETTPSPNFDDAPLRQHGADALFVASTSIGISILGRAAYQRYVTAVAGDLDPPPLAFDQLPADSVYLPSGQITGGRATINRLALVGASSANSLSPCRQLYAHRLLSSYDPTPAACTRRADGSLPRDCPCKSNGERFCLVPAIVQVLPQAGDVIDVLVVADTEPTLQALRTELRPDQPEVDGILGTEVLRGLELDVDYPHDRLLARCTGPTCLVRPALEESGDVCQINRCTTGAAQPLGCGGNPRYQLLAPDEQ